MLKDYFTLGNKFAIIHSKTFQFAFVFQTLQKKTLSKLCSHLIINHGKIFFQLFIVARETFHLLDEDDILI